MKDLKAEERLAQWAADMALWRDQLAQALARIHELEGQRSKDSHHSHQPPSRQQPWHKTQSQRKANGKPGGGQAGHALALVDVSDCIVTHRQEQCM